jgi:DNA gyrase/topoisomerase IV subunit A
LNDGDELVGACLTDGRREIYMGSRGGMAIRFPETDVRSMHRVSTGVIGMRLRNGDAVVDMGLVDESGNCWPSANGAMEAHILQRIHAPATGWIRRYHDAGDRQNRPARQPARR